MMSQEIIPSNRIQELITDIYYLKMEINSTYKCLSPEELQGLMTDRLDKKKELYRLMILKDRKEKITKIRQKI